MAEIHISFYSYRPRLKVGLVWTTDNIPNIGDEIEIKNEFISEWDKKYFSEWERKYGRSFRVKKRIWNLDKGNWYNHDVSLVLDWTEKEKIEVDKYLTKNKKRNAT